MKKFTAFEYLMIDIANHFGHDKLKFEERIDWAKANINKFPDLIDQAENKPLFIKTMMAIEAARQGKPIGHLVGFDGVCSGVQIMSALTGCEAGADATGLIDPDRRADAYTQTTDVMGKILGNAMSVKRSDAKRALMTSCYGSKAVPIEVFGEDTPELEAFYEAMGEVAPGAWELLQILTDSWQPYALSHEWKLPDGYDAKVKVLKKIEDTRINADELGGYFIYEYYENQGTKKGVSNVANVIHSIDAYVLRCIHRRCNYNLDVVMNANTMMNAALKVRSNTERSPVDYETKLGYYIEQWERSSVVDVVILPYITEENVNSVPTGMLIKLVDITSDMLMHKPFPVVTIHDEFKCHANNMNHLRYHYKEILADLADSTLLDDILSQLYEQEATYTKLSENLGDKIRNANYSLC